MRYRDLVEVLDSCGKTTHTIQLANQTRVLLLPHGGRVLGLFSPSDDENYYWTHPALQTVESARAFYSSGQWENSGGDRTWLAPEVELFFPRFPDLDMSGYFQPRLLDPGHYRIEHEDGEIRMINSFFVDLFRSKVTLELCLKKQVGPTADPLRYERAFSGASELEFAGYEQHTALDLLSGDEGQVGLWNLIQMPHGGEMIVATSSRAEPRIYFGKVKEEDLTSNRKVIRWRMYAEGEQKIGVRAVHTTGRVGYLYGSHQDAKLVVRNFFVNPGGEYVDVPWTEQTDFGYAVQACSVNGWLGQFSELEYHVPAIGAGTRRRHCEDVSQVWAYRGPRAALEEVVECLICPE